MFVTISFLHRGKDFKDFEVMGSKLWFSFTSSRSQSSFGYKFDVLANFAESSLDVEDLTLVDGRRVLIVQSSTEKNGRQVKFLSHVLKDLMNYPAPKDPRDSAIHGSIRLYASLIMANLTMTEIHTNKSTAGTTVTAAPVENIKAKLRKELGYKYFFPPHTTRNPLILRLCSLCISELLELSENQQFTRGDGELGELIEKVAVLSRETDVRCSLYAMKALSLLAKQQENILEFLLRGGLEAIYDGTRTQKSAEVLKFAWDGFHALSKSLDVVLEFALPSQEASKATEFDPALLLQVTSQHSTGEDWMHFRCNSPFVSGVHYAELCCVHGGVVCIGLSPASWRPTPKKSIGQDQLTIAFDGSRWVGLASGTEIVPLREHMGKTDIGNNMDEWKPGCIVGVLIDCDTNTVEVFVDGNAVGVRFEDVAVGSGLMLVASLYKGEAIKLNMGHESFAQFPSTKKDVLTSRSPRPSVLLEHWNASSATWDEVVPGHATLLEPVESTTRAIQYMRAQAWIYLRNVIPQDSVYFHDAFHVHGKGLPCREFISRPGATMLSIELKVAFSTVRDRKERLVIYEDLQGTKLLKEITNVDKISFEEDGIVVFSDFIRIDMVSDDCYLEGVTLPSFDARIKPTFSKSIDWEKLMNQSTASKDSAKKVLAIFESLHNYEDNSNIVEKVSFSSDIGAVEIVFDPQTYTENNYDYLQFFLDEACTITCSERLSGSENWPGWTPKHSLIIPSNRFWFKFVSDGSNNYWGYKFSCIASDLLTNRLAGSDQYEVYCKGDIVDSEVLTIKVDEGDTLAIAFDENFACSFNEVIEVYTNDPSDHPDTQPKFIFCNRATSEYLKNGANKVDEDEIQVHLFGDAGSLQVSQAYLKRKLLDPNRRSFPCMEGSHMMEKLTTQIGWRCDLCDATNVSPKRWNCNACGFDVCFTCVPKDFYEQCLQGFETKFCSYRKFDAYQELQNAVEEVASVHITVNEENNGDTILEEVDLSTVVAISSANDSTTDTPPCCKEGHPMTCAEGRQWNCDGCGEMCGRRSGRRWQCREDGCDYDVCFSCQDPRVVSTAMCTGNHAMTQQAGSDWRCDMCSEFEGKVGRWQCRQCDYDICFTCIPETTQERNACCELCIVVKTKGEVDGVHVQFFGDHPDEDSTSDQKLSRYGSEAYSLEDADSLPSIETPLVIYHPKSKEKLFIRVSCDDSSQSKQTHVLKLITRN